jgi:hypothetical protein
VRTASTVAAPAPRAGPWSIWLLALSYFIAYVPYSGLTKAATSGGDAFAGVRLLPSTALASLLATVGLLLGTGWWRRADGIRVGRWLLPAPGRWTLLSGLCSAVIIATTTLAYTFAGASIVFMMLLMRGGLLVLAPLVDGLSQRRVSSRAWLGLALSLCGVGVAAVGRWDLRFGWVAALDVAAYLLAYFCRLRAMSHVAKTDESAVRMRYFVEEQIVSTPALVAVLAILGAVGVGPQLQALRVGFEVLWQTGATLEQLGIGAFSQAAGVFGALILLQPQENSFCVPVNRASSILAGVVATAGLAALQLGPAPDGRELVGAGLVLLAVVVLAAQAPRQGSLRPVLPSKPSS